ncbi:hydrolase [Actinoplanes sp. OR16]|uniref:cellulose-binding domain-containing protein n=1 Tax=Actinoplanes sp. OR16 TaxID=946334 RepID=UPI000F6F6443|nr:cellulose-binding domain-containing protein [Actinoplanes sp. OR16]BBH70195.1 hydrolase [Actinoplanes sp. OR16]
MRLRSALAAAAVAVASGGIATVLHVPAAEAATVCAVDFTVNQWSTGFTADVKLTNTGPAVSSWTLTWSFPGDQRVTNGWNAQVSQSGQIVTASSVGWNGSLATGASASFGFQATYSGTNAKPVDFALNGVSCAGDTPPSTSPSTSPSTDPGPDCPSWARCDGFEDQAAGAPSGNWAVTYPDCQGAGTATVDKSVGRTGSTSLRVDGAAGYCNHVFVRSTDILGPAGSALYVRYYVRHTTALPASHFTTVALRDANDGNRDLRFGGQNQALQWNRGSDDATLPEQSPSGVALSRPLPVNTWNCVEFKVSGADGTMETWLDGVSVPGLLQDGVPTHDVDGQWLNRTYRPMLTDLKLGWESYGEGADTLWYDDVAAGSSRIGC